jgi:hypothetical protein
MLFNTLHKKTYLTMPLPLFFSKRFMWKNVTKIIKNTPKVPLHLEPKVTALELVKKDSNVTVEKEPTIIAIPEHVSIESQEYVNAKLKESTLAETTTKLVQVSKYDILKNLVLVKDETRLKHHATKDYFIDKYIPAYIVENAKIICLIQEPISLAGIFTMAEAKINSIQAGTDKLQNTLSYSLMHYCYHMYKDPLNDPTKIASRIDKLFTYESSFLYKHPPQCVHGYESNFPVKQHLLAADTHNLVLDVASLKLPSQLQITQQYITLNKYLEISVFLKTHGFLLTDNIEVLLVDSNNKVHTSLCQLNANKFVDIMGQINPDFTAKIPIPPLIAIPGNELSVIPIDTKLYTLPEQSIALYNSYSTLSPSLQKDVFVHRSKVCALAQINKMKKPGVSLDVEDNLKDYLNVLQDVSKKVKDKKITPEEGFFTIQTFNQQIIRQPHKYNLYPTFIETALIDNAFNLSWNTNKNMYEIVLQDIGLLVQKEAKILFQNNHKYNSYSFDLFIQKVLKKMELLGPGYLDNYYNLRKILTITY